jgi:ribokinase
VVLNYAPAKIHDVGLLRDLDTLVVNENEALALAGIEPTDPSSAQACAETLLAFGPSRVLLTLGRRGCMLLGKENERVDCPAFEVVALDTTAAGDTFCGALCAALMEKRPVADALRFASAAAAISVTRLGAQSSIPFRPSIEAFLASR